MHIRKFEEDIKKIKTITQLPNGEYSEEDDIFINSFIMRFRELIKPLSIANKQDFEKSVQNYKKSIKKFANRSQTLLELVKPIYHKKMMKSLKWKAWKN
ncbi:hypothetical protein ES703_05859 [subsurface metagenome]